MTKNYDSVVSQLLLISTISSIKEITSSITKKRNLLSLLVVFVALFSFVTNAQTTLISSTGDGGFENGTTLAANNWTAVNSSTDSWTAGTTPTVSAGARCAFISSTSGGAQTWTYSQVSSIQHMYYDVTIPAGETIVTLAFKWKAGGEGTTTSDWDNLKVFWGTTTAIAAPVANTALSSTFQISGPGAISGMYKLSSTTYNNETITVSGVPGSTYRLVFSWKSDITDIANPPAALDEISLTSRVALTPDAAPINYSASAVTQSGMTINWVDNSTNETAFRVYRSTDNINFVQIGANIASTTTVGTGTAYSSNQTGLSSGTTYYYRVVSFIEAESAPLIGTQATLTASTYYWTGATGGSWDLLSNWNTSADGLGTNPSAWTNSDIHIIDGAGTTPGGALSISVDKASFTIGQIKIISNTNLSLTSNATTTRTITISGGPNEDFVLENGSTLNLTSATNAVAFNFTGSVNTGTIAGTYIAGGSTSNTINTTGGSGTLVTVTSTGNVNNTILGSSGCLLGSVATLNFTNGSNYTHSSFTTTNGFIPLATWGTSSNVFITGGTTSTGLTNAAQAFGNFTYNSATSTATFSAFTTSTTGVINGNLTISNTNTGTFRALTSGTLTVNGNVIITQGRLQSASSTGTFIANGATTIDTNGILDILAGSYSQRGNTFTNNGTLTGPAGTLQFVNFTGSATQTLAGSGTVLTNIANLNMQNTAGLTITHVNPIILARVNLFQGTITNSNKITFGTGLSVNCVTQIGSAGLTTPGGSFDSLPLFNLGTGTYSVSYAQESVSRTSGFEIPSTRSINNLVVNNTNGFTISGGDVTTISSLALTNGIVTTGVNNLILGNSSTVGTLTGSSETAYVNGSLTRSIATANTNTTYVAFPIGKSGIYTPIALAPATTSIALFKAESFGSNTGTSDPSIIGLSTTRRFEALPVSGTFTDINVRLADAAIVSTNIPVQAPTAIGAYSSAFGSVATFSAGTPNTIQSNFPVTSSNYTGFLSFANSNACSGTPTPGNTTASSSTICFGESVTLSLQNITNGSGVTYQWKSSTDGTTYSNLAGATNPTLTLIPTEATYYLCDVTCSSGSVTGTSVAVQVTFTNNITATTPGTRCGTGTIDLVATPNTGASVNWYTAQSGGVLVGSGNNFTTPSISATTTFYAIAETTTTLNGLARIAPVAIAGTTPANYGLVFDANEAFSINSVDVFLNSTTSGNVTVVLQNSTGTTLQTITIAVPAGNATTPLQHTLNLNFNVPSGIGYRLLATTGVGMVRESALGGFPYNLGPVGAITSGYISGTTTTYYYFYNWSINTTCSSESVPVIATVTAPPALTLSTSATTICESDSSSAVTLTSTASDYDTYVWSPSTGVSGNSTTGWIFNPTVSTTYTLNASQSTGSLCVSSTTVVVTVNPLPTVITFSPASSAVCVDTIQPLTAIGGTIGSNGSTAIGTATTLTTENNTDPTAFNNRYEHYWLQMVFTQAELNAAGVQAGNINGIKFDINSIGSAAFVSDFKVNLGSTTLNTITGFTPIGLTQVYSAATYNQTIGSNSIVFNTPYSWDGTSNIIVDIRSTGADSANNSATYYTATADNKTVSAVTSTTFASSDAYVASNPTGTLSLKRLNTTFDWTSSLPTDVTWSPVNNLYTDAAATVAYVANTNAPTVYFKSSTAAVATTYTATATSAFGCSRTATTDVTVNALTSNSTTVSVCDSYTWAENGTTYTASGVYTSITGCNTETLNLTITTGSSLPNEVVSACDTYTWAANGTVYTTGGTYTSTTNCVTRTLNLTINASPSNATTQSGDTLSATETGATYQWLLCDGSFTPISGATSQSYLVTAIGSYAVDITKNGCTVRSACVNVTALGNATFDLTKLSYYPNPVLDMFTVRYSENITSIDVYDLSGRRVKNSTSNNTEVTLNMSDLAASVYVVKVYTEGKSSEFKIVKK